MRDYEKLVGVLRVHAQREGCVGDECPYYDAENRGYGTCSEEMAKEAADAIEELMIVARTQKAALECYKNEMEAT